LGEARERIDLARQVDHPGLFPAIIYELDEGQPIGNGRFVEQHDHSEPAVHD
jgi:hypothetical protein